MSNETKTTTTDQAADETKTTDQTQTTGQTADETKTTDQTQTTGQTADEGKTKPTPKPKSKTKDLDPEEPVDFTAPYDPTGEKRDILLAVNGATVRVKRGETVQIKRKFVEAWNNSLAQTNEARRAQEKARGQAKTPLLNM